MSIPQQAFAFIIHCRIVGQVIWTSYLHFLPKKPPHPLQYWLSVLDDLAAISLVCMTKCFHLCVFHVLGEWVLGLVNGSAQTQKVVGNALL